jgi:hypothetical protein
MRVFVAGQAERNRYPLKLARKAAASCLGKSAGRPLIRFVRGGFEVRGLPGDSALSAG